MTKAWHLRQDGKAFPVQVHMYCMGDEDLSSEAEVAAFIIKSDSDDQDLAEYVLDAWMALLIEQEVSYDADEEGIKETIKSALQHLPYHFQYGLSEAQLLAIHDKLGNYKDVDALYSFVDEVRGDIEDIQENIKKSINQQFCRVRYGGQYDSYAGNNEIWFRISSVGYNWVNPIYVFTSSILRSYKLSHITICRDSESDDAKQEYFYKAKDGAIYKHMPIEEYIIEEHEHNPVFENLHININEGVLVTLRKLLREGLTYASAVSTLRTAGAYYQRDLWKYLLKNEKSLYCESSELEGGFTRNHRRRLNHERNGSYSQET